MPSFIIQQALAKVKDSPSKIVVKPKQRSKATNDKFPKEWLENSIWRKKAIPTLFYWAGIQENPWVISDEKIAEVLTKICDASFSNSIDYMMTTNCEAVCIISTVQI